MEWAINNFYYLVGLERFRAANSINQANIISGLVSQGAQAYGMSQGGGGSGGGAPPQNIPYGLPMGGPSNFLTSNPMMVA